jgi:2-phosphosulfolactate phosphatase
VTIVGLGDEVPSGAVVVVVDVIRAFTTAAVAFERGVTDIVCVPSVQAGRGLRAQHPDRLLVGESHGLRPADYDFGNSPADLAAAELDGRGLIQATSNGTRGLAQYPDPAALLAVAAVNVGATARWIRQHHPAVPYAIVCTGSTAEDRACARHLSALIDGLEPRREDLVAGIEEGAAQHAAAYARKPAADRVDLSRDLPFCREVDRSDFAMVGEIRDGHVRLLKV